MRLASRFGLSLEDALVKYTTFPNSLSLGDPERSGQYFAGLAAASDPAEWTIRFYRGSDAPDSPSRGEPFPDGTFQGNRLFGCFYFSLREGHVIRPHFIKNLPHGSTVLGMDAVETRKAEIAAMFAHIRASGIDARIVQGNSWLYNVDAYRRLYPPTYTSAMEISPYDEYQYLALWGQFYDRDWKVKEDIARKLLERVDKLDELSKLDTCFPYRILRPTCEIEEFYRFYEIDQRGPDHPGAGTG